MSRVVQRVQYDPGRAILLGIHASLRFLRTSPGIPISLWRLFLCITVVLSPTRRAHARQCGGGSALYIQWFRAFTSSSVNVKEEPKTKAPCSFTDTLRKEQRPFFLSQEPPRYTLYMISYLSCQKRCFARSDRPSVGGFVRIGSVIVSVPDSWHFEIIDPGNYIIISRQV